MVLCVFERVCRVQVLDASRPVVGFDAAWKPRSDSEASKRLGGLEAIWGALVTAIVYYLQLEFDQKLNTPKTLLATTILYCFQFEFDRDSTPPVRTLVKAIEFDLKLEME